MTNKELNNLFQTIAQSEDNIFDIYETLHAYENQYEEMRIKNLIPTIYDAWKLYCEYDGKTNRTINKFMNADFTNVVNAFDLTKLFDEIPEEYKESSIALLNSVSKL